MKTVSARELAASLNHIDIACEPVLEGNPNTSEHGEVSISMGKRPMTVFISPTDDTLYLAVWQPNRGNYKVCPTYHYAGQLHRLIRDIRQHV